MGQHAISIFNFKNDKEKGSNFFKPKNFRVHSRLCQYGFAFPYTVSTTELPAYTRIYPLIIFLPLLQQMLKRGSPLVRASNSCDLSLILRHNTCTYRTKNVNNLGSFLSMRGFFISLTSLTHTNYLSILSRVFLLLKNDRISEQIQAPCTYVHTRLNIGKKKRVFYLSCCSKISHVGISVTYSSVSTVNTSFINFERKYVLN
jgi:hypothetical protein